MKQINLLILALILTTSTINAQFFQPGNITDNNNNTTEGRVLIDNSEKKVFIKIDRKTQSYSFINILTVTSNNRLYSKIEFENDNVLGYQLVSGKASLYHLSQEDYLIKKETGEGRIFNLETDKAQIPGILGLLFNDCNEIRDAIQISDAINERILIDIVSDYNNCNYSEYTPTENEMKNANAHNADVVRFYGGFQTNFTSTSVNGFSSVNTTGYGIGFGLSASPTFTGKMQGNLYFDFDVSLIFTGDNVYNNGLTPLNYKVNSYRFSLGVEYIFNKKGTLQPFLGIGYGYSSDLYEGRKGAITFKTNNQSYFYLPKVGVLYKLNNDNHIGLTVGYLEYTNNLGYGNPDPIQLYIESSFISVGLNYHF